MVDDLRLLDGQRVQVDIFQAGDLAIVHQSAKLGHGRPLLLLLLSLALALALALSLLAFTLALVSKSTFAESSVSSHVWQASAVANTTRMKPEFGFLLK